MKKTIAAHGGVLPRMAAERFGTSPWLTVTVLCLAFSCGMTMFSSMQGMRSGAEILTVVSVVFNLAYVFAGAAFLYFLWLLRTSVTEDRCRKAGVAAAALGGVLLTTVMFLAMFYFSAYTVMASLSAEEMAEMQMSQDSLNEAREKIPFIIMSLFCTLVQGIAFILFRAVLKRVGAMSMGKRCETGIFTGSAVLSSLAGGFVLGQMMIDIVANGSIVQTIFIVIKSLADAGVYAGLMMLSQGTLTALRGD